MGEMDNAMALDCQAFNRALVRISPGGVELMTWLARREAVSKRLCKAAQGAGAHPEFRIFCFAPRGPVARVCCENNSENEKIFFAAGNSWLAGDCVLRGCGILRGLRRARRAG